MLRHFLCCSILFLSLGTTAFAEYSYIIQPRSYLTSTHYDLYSGSSYLNTVEQNSLQLRRVYSLCNEKGELATGTARLLSVGALFNSMKEIDVVNERGRHVGFIQGRWWTTASGKYAFYDDSNYHIATAYVDRSGSSVSIVDSKNERSPIAIFRRSFVPGGDYYWDIKVLKDEAIDPRMLYIFSAFITDAYWPAAPEPRNSALETLEMGILLKSILDDE